MAKRIAPLSDIQVKNAKSKEKDYKLYDGGGLNLLITARQLNMCKHSGSGNFPRV